MDLHGPRYSSRISDQPQVQKIAIHILLYVSRLRDGRRVVTEASRRVVASSIALDSNSVLLECSTIWNSL